MFRWVSGKRRAYQTGRRAGSPTPKKTGTHAAVKREPDSLPHHREDRSTLSNHKEGPTTPLQIRDRLSSCEQLKVPEKEWRSSLVAPSDRHSHDRRRDCLTRQPTSSTSLLDGGYVTEESYANLLNGSLYSDTSPASSYKTPASSLTMLASSGDLTMSPKDDLIQSMKELFECRMNRLEEKIESSQRKLESRVDGIEKRLQAHIESTTASTEITDRRGSQLPVLKEAAEEAGDEDVNKEAHSTSSHVVMGDSNSVGTSSQRRYTDSEAMKMVQYRDLMRKRKEYAQKKSLSLQDSRLLPKPCNQQVIMWLTQRVTNWKFLARWLNLPENEVSRIGADNQGSNREQCYQMFLRWRATDPDNYTYPVLGYALQKESQELFNDYVKEVHRVENNIQLNLHE